MRQAEKEATKPRTMFVEQMAQQTEVMAAAGEIMTTELAAGETEAMGSPCFLMRRMEAMESIPDRRAEG